MERTVRLLALALSVLLLHSLSVSARWNPKYANSDPSIQKWFSTQHNSQGQWCCDESDGHPWFDGYEFDNDGNVVLYLNGVKRVIPKDKVLNGHNPTGHAVYWFRDIGDQHVDYCLAPGSLT